jgi:hypothetical protein
MNEVQEKRIQQSYDTLINYLKEKQATDTEKGNAFILGWGSGRVCYIMKDNKLYRRYSEDWLDRNAKIRVINSLNDFEYYAPASWDVKLYYAKKDPRDGISQMESYLRAVDELSYKAEVTFNQFLKNMHHNKDLGGYGD